MKRVLLACLLCLYAGLLPARDGQPAPDFTLPTLAGGEVSLAQLRGKVVYLDFWASWCGPCRKSFPWLEGLRRRLASQGLEIVAVNIDRRRQAAERFLQKVPVNFTIALDPDGKVADRYRVEFMPTAYLIDRQGQVVARHFGFREEDKDAWEARVLELLALPAQGQKTTPGKGIQSLFQPAGQAAVSGGGQGRGPVKAAHAG